MAGNCLKSIEQPDRSVRIRHYLLPPNSVSGTYYLQHPLRLPVHRNRSGLLSDTWKFGNGIEKTACLIMLNLSVAAGDNLTLCGVPSPLAQRRQARSRLPIPASAGMKPRTASTVSTPTSAHDDDSFALSECPVDLCIRSSSLDIASVSTNNLECFATTGVNTPLDCWGGCSVFAEVRGQKQGVSVGMPLPVMQWRCAPDEQNATVVAMTADGRVFGIEPPEQLR